MKRREFIKTTSAATSVGALATSFAFSPAVPARSQSKSEISPSIIKAIRDRIMPITSEERLQRIENARNLMFENSIDALFVEGGTSLNYFTGAKWGRSERLFSMILPQKGEPFYIAPKFEEGRALEQTGKAKLFTWEENESPYELIKKVLTQNNLLSVTLGIEETTRYFCNRKFIFNKKSYETLSIPLSSACRNYFLFLQQQ